MSNNASPFVDMADRISSSKEEEFGGALVLIAPDGTKLEFLLTNPDQNLIGFWGFVKASIEDKFNEIQKNVMSNNPMGWPR